MEIESLDQSEELRCHLNAFAASPRGFILLSGKNGTGKSYAALAAYNAFAPYRLPAYDYDIARFITQAELNILWNRHQNDGNSGYLLDMFIKTKLLVLDDIGTRTPSEAFMDFLYLVADMRYTKRDSRGTIITTNLTSNSMRDMFGDAFVSRVASGKCFRLEGKDRRFNEF